MASGSPFGAPGTAPSEPESPLAGRSKLRQEITPTVRTRSRSRSGSGSSDTSPEPTASRPRRSSIKGNGNANAIALGLGSDGKKSVHFTPSTGGLTSTDDQSEGVSTPGTETGFQFSYAPPPQAGTASSGDSYTPPITQSVPTTSAAISTTPLSQYSPPQAQASAASIYTSPSQKGALNGYPNSVSPYFPTAGSNRSSPPTVTSHPSPPNGYSPPSRASSTQSEVMLTPAIIAKAQKHCRFAISSLDYEDAEQARKELRAALATLGGL